MQWRRRWWLARDSVLDLLFPPQCAGCGQRGQWLCTDCLAAIERIRPPFCPRCGRPQPQERLCHLCRVEPLTIDGIRSAAYFEGGLRQAIHRFKYGGIQALAGPLAEILVEHQTDNSWPADIIVPVPLHPDRQAERGYNQAELLARAMAARLELPTAEKALERVRATAPQVELDVRQRRSNVAGAFQVQTKDVASHRVLLIDDVCTTGATMDACGQALKTGGAQAVWGLALARGR
ncbi:MAG: double zinc ribbon domain-containing protein [Anaerolineae bacterium]